MISEGPPAGVFIRDCGFTLIEILIAVSIFGVIAVIVYGSFNALLSRTGLIKAESSVNEMAANCLNRISMDLQALYVEQPPLYKPPDYDDEPDPYRFAGNLEYVGGKQFPGLRFVSGEHLPFSNRESYDQEDNTATKPGLTRIRYHVDKERGTSPDSGYALKRGDDPFPYEAPDSPANAFAGESENDPVLCTGITGLEFTYFDSEGREFETWDSEEESRDYATPRGVGITLKVKAGGVEQIFSTRITLSVYREPLESVKR